MPEVAVYEHRDLASREDEIRSSRQLAAPAPARDAVLSHHSHEADFRGVVPVAADTRHDSRTVFRFENSPSY